MMVSKAMSASRLAVGFVIAVTAAVVHLLAGLLLTGTSDAPGGAAILVSRVLASPLYLVWKGIGATGAPPVYLNFLNSLLWGLAIVWIASRRWGGFRQVHDSSEQR